MLPFASSLCILAALATASFALQSGVASAAVPDVSKSRMYSSAISSVIAAVTPMLALIYFCPLYLLYRHSKRNPRPLNKVSGTRLQQYGPREHLPVFASRFYSHLTVVYVFLLFSSLAGVRRTSILRHAVLILAIHRSQPPPGFFFSTNIITMHLIKRCDPAFDSYCTSR